MPVSLHDIDNFIGLSPDEYKQLENIFTVTKPRSMLSAKALEKHDNTIKITRQENIIVILKTGLHDFFTRLKNTFVILYEGP